MSVPWQSDFNDCQFEDPLAWWPAQRPDEVYAGKSDTPVRWTRGIVDGPEDMIARWHRLGFVVKDGEHSGDRAQGRRLTVAGLIDRHRVHDLE